MASNLLRLYMVLENNYHCMHGALKGVKSSKKSSGCCVQVISSGRCGLPVPGAAVFKEDRGNG
ncbi:MAG: hypothetical protein KAW12_14915 [Candidatus Aminicenantes bacterium]|nr:hypothetical protein [Candidatus Aminicenantes bacterium]